MLDEPMVDEPPDERTGRPPPDEKPRAPLPPEPRERILRLVRKTPGIRVADLQVAADMTAGLFHHHMRHLRRAGLVETRSTGTTVRAYPAGEVVPPEDGPLDSQAVRNVATVVMRNPGATSKEIAGALGIAPRAALLHLRTLREHGLVERAFKGWTWRYRPTEALRAALKPDG